jgi:hypothetical protein
VVESTLAKRKRRKEKAQRADQDQQADAQPQEEQPRRFGWIPLWGWILIFLLPLIVSEFMFYRAGRRVSMILFPIAWFGFWASLMQRAGWPILKKRDEG